jgi:hypothetical protein
VILWHYTCLPAADKIRETGVIRPYPQPELDGLPVVWLADFRRRTPTLRSKLALAWHSVDRPACHMEIDPCDPVAARFGVHVDIDHHPHVWPFSRLAVDYPAAHRMYRGVPGAQPWRWWLALSPIRLTKSPILNGARHV